MNSGVWIPDHAARQCYRCGTPFGLLLRRHHCRVCGRIFCAECTLFKASVPAGWQVRSPDNRLRGLWTWATAGTDDAVVVGSPSERPGHLLQAPTDGQRRVCQDCGVQVDDTLKHEDVLRLFECLMASGVGPVEWRALACTSRAFSKVVGLLRRRWRGVQRLLPFEKATNSQKRFMRRMVPFADPRHVGIATVLEREGFRAPARAFPVSCGAMGCRADCARLPPEFAWLVSIVFGARDTARRLTGQFVNRTATIKHCMVNALAAASVVDKYLVADVLVPLCQNDENLGIMLYFALRGRDTTVSDLLLGHLPAETRKCIRRSETWVYCMKVLGKVVDGIPVFPREPVRLPTDPNLEVVRVLHENVIRKRSSSEPTVVPCQCRVRTAPGRLFVKCFMVKKEDVRPDACAMDFVRMLSLCLDGQYENAETVAYAVLPLAPDAGIITVVPGSRTLYSLNEEGTTLQNWVLENNTNYSIDYIRRRFLRSCAFATTASMMLQVGDRHLENLMLTRGGLLFHVDYAMLLGKEPHLKSLVGNTMRITPQMVDFLGGTKSAYYAAFQKLCGSIYARARECIFPLYACMKALVYDDYCHDAMLTRSVKAVFCPDDLARRARITVEDRVDRESAKVKWSDTILDSVHHWWNVLKG